MNTKIGFMQGRLSDQVNGLIQSFPWENWENEFFVSRNIGISLMEWTLDHKNLYQNPLMKEKDRLKILELSKKNQLSIKSLTGDCFMQNPFWKAESKKKDNLHQELIDICRASSLIGIKIIVVPLVDNGMPENEYQEDQIIQFFKSIIEDLKSFNLKIAFECEFKPLKVAKFIERLEYEQFGINYDTGNSAAIGYLPKEEFKSYGERIINIHIKDRKLRGETIELGNGAANFKSIFEEIAKIKYVGNFILQTARCENKNHAEKISKYGNFIDNLMLRYLS